MASSQYSLDLALRFDWASVTGRLEPGRASVLEKHALGSHVLDAGCGGGAYVDYLASMGYQATGVDLHEQFLTVARERGYRGTYVLGDITQLPFPNEAFETTFCFDVLEHVDDRAAIRELRRVSSRRIILAVPKEDNELTEYGLTFNQYRDPTHIRYYTPESLEALGALIDATSVQVEEELPLPVKRLLWHLIEPQTKRHGLRGMQQQAGRRVVRALLGRMGVKPIFSGLLALIDFGGPQGS